MVVFPELLKEVVMAVAVGGLIGLERENEPRRKYAGLRTMSLLAGIAPIAVALSESSGSMWPVAVYLLMAAAFSTVLSVVRYGIEEEDIGFTTSIAVFMVAALGALVGYNFYLEAAAITILVVIILAEKELIHGYASKLSDSDISDAMKLGVLVFILLPILPSQPVGPFNAINLRETLILAIFVLLIEFIAFVSMKQIGSSQGLKLTGLLGGGASSFATTGVMTKIAEKDPGLLKTASSAAILSILSMIVRNIVIVSAIGWNVALRIIYPVITMCVLSLIAGFIWRDNKSSVENAGLSMNSPFSFGSAAKFAAVFIAISLISAFAENFLGQTWIFATAFAGGMVSSAAVSTSAAALFSKGSIQIASASGMVLLSILGSMVSKILLIETANKDMRRYVSVPMLLIGIIGLAVFLI
ncbi:MAG: DUF4010 domain-containing protein [Candidatus Nanohaloarchaea archaeon]|nr:DUF4010 domain-containing protein [Candidatus Nanohaloarchaea archaeon]